MCGFFFLSCVVGRGGVLSRVVRVHVIALTNEVLRPARGDKPPAVGPYFRVSLFRWDLEGVKCLG